MKKTIAIVLLLVTFVLLGLVGANAQTDETKEAAQYYSVYISDFETKQETIQYRSKQKSNHMLASIHPTYSFEGEISCVPIAGTCILGYYDRFYDNLIPNFIAGRLLGESYIYKAQDSNVKNAAIQLAYAMGADALDDGVAVDGFKSGMKSYCQNKNLSVSLEQGMSWGQFDFDKAKIYLEQNKPLIIFTSRFNLVFTTETDNEDILNIRVSAENHAMAVFGYSEITYTMNNGTVQTCRYLRVATGLTDNRYGYVDVDSNITIDDAYAVVID